MNDAKPKSVAKKASIASLNRSTPFSSIYEHTMTIYDNLPYSRDIDLCTSDFLFYHNSMLIHAYRYDTEPYPVKVRNFVEPHGYFMN